MSKFEGQHDVVLHGGKSLAKTGHVPGCKRCEWLASLGKAKPLMRTDLLVFLITRFPAESNEKLQNVADDLAKLMRGDA